MFTAIALVRARSNPLKWLLALGAPFLFTYFLYWTPVWLGTSSEEYSKWAPIFIIPWFAAGAITSALVILFVGALRKRRR
jgi:ABC-type Co2+ transport system permease subunit